MALVFVAYLFLTWPIYKIQGWDTFKFLGADRRIKRCYFSYQVFLAHLKCACMDLSQLMRAVDYFILLAFSLQLVLLVLDQNDIERYLTLAAVPITLGFLIMGYLGVKRENKFLTILFMFTMGGSIGYFSYKLFRIYQNPDGIYTLVKKSLTGFAILALLAAASTFAWTVRCYYNFDKGLKRHLDGTWRIGRQNTRLKTLEAGLSPEPSPELSKSDYQYQLHSAATSRMSID